MSTTSRMPGSWSSSDTEDWNDAEEVLSTSSTLALDKSQPPTPDGTGLPVNFHLIGPGLFRSSYPLMNHFSILESYGFKTIITLVPGDILEENRVFFKNHGINHHQIHVVANKVSDVYPSAETISSIIKIMMNRANHPVLIHCNKGKHRTGCVAAIFRRCTGWPLEACIEEYEKYAALKARDLDKAFISRFDVKELKALALQEGFVTGAFAPPHNLADSSNASAYTNNTFVSYETSSTMNA